VLVEVLVEVLVADALKVPELPGALRQPSQLRQAGSTPRDLERPLHASIDALVTNVN